jgi:NAD(P)-dependent dehydrogenase (short-subunit alcohol dehydrogenase family)
MRFQNKTVIVTGARRGIGLATVIQFAKEGANVVVNGRSQESMDESLRQAREKVPEGNFLGFAADVGYRDQVEAMMQETLRTYARIDIVINNAGICHTEPFLTASDEWWDDHIRINLNSMFYMCQLAGRQMVKQGVGGSIINLSSIAATQAHRNSVSYDTSKGGVEAFTRALALELAPWNIRVNALSPAAILGNFVKEKPAEWREKMMLEKYDTPLIRQGTPEDCAEIMAFLSSDAASFITGQAIYIDGGLSAQARPYCLAPLMLTPHNIDKTDILS